MYFNHLKPATEEATLPWGPISPIHVFLECSDPCTADFTITSVAHPRVLISVLCSDHDYPLTICE